MQSDNEAKVCGYCGNRFPLQEKRQEGKASPPDYSHTRNLPTQHLSVLPSDGNIIQTTIKNSGPRGMSGVLLVLIAFVQVVLSLLWFTRAVLINTESIIPAQLILSENYFQPVTLVFFFAMLCGSTAFVLNVLSVIYRQIALTLRQIPQLVCAVANFICYAYFVYETIGAKNDVEELIERRIRFSDGSVPVFILTVVLIVLIVSAIICQKKEMQTFSTNKTI